MGKHHSIANRATDPVSLLQDFFSQLYIEDRFNTIAKEHISGWENWLQIEFAYFLSRRISDENGQWWREYKIRWDNMPPDMDSVKPDFWLWAGTDKHYHLIEFKQSSSTSKTALRGLNDDIEKLSSLSLAREFDVVGDTECYTCTSKVFVLVLVSQRESPSETVCDAATTIGGKIGDSGWY
ncbi:hypothetical protein A1OO_03295 [Enterovibrio norvegicus FF-33]|uniref:hypothetical protein n=1 Tax=Enterovibrio norvegicus TaxID=188144 RepID=UPI000307CCD7|nr:hypothetical protein [Enterovibrio norvegicus]OEE69820.1 hypothetical protein A1OO_03295 [Enterovibrio norvegicus FF-33]